MARNFSRARCIELSMVKYLTDQVNANWTGVAVIKDFLNAVDAPGPVICVQMLSTATQRWEIGSTTPKQQFTFVIDIFANSDGQRIDLDDFIVNTIMAGPIPYYDCTKDPGNSANILFTQNGGMTVVRFLTDRRITALDNENIENKWRQSLSFVVTKY